MYDYVIIHASFGHPFEHWYSWLFKKLTSQGKNVLIPQFPCGKEEQNYENWCKIMDAYRPYVNENTSYIGHSIGPAFIIDYLADNKLKAKNLYLVAPLYDKIDIPDYDYVNSTFFECDKLSTIPNLVNMSICYISRNDPYVPNQLSERIAEIINATKIYVDDAGHFNTSSGYVEFMKLLEDIGLK